MIVILASRFDAHAEQLAERWRGRGACLLTCEDLSRSGWRHESGAPQRSFAVLDGNRVPVASIRGVLTRLYAVTEHELPHIVPDERPYVAAEMTAFLLAWLASLRCPVLNRPTPASLCGPSLSNEQWLSEAARAGLRIEPLRRVLPPFAGHGSAVRITSPAIEGVTEDATSLVTFVGGRHWPEREGELLDPGTLAGVRRLTEAVRVELLTATFVGRPGMRRLVRAVPWVEPDRPEIAAALIERMERAS